VRSSPERLIAPWLPAEPVDLVDITTIRILDGRPCDHQGLSLRHALGCPGCRGITWTGIRGRCGTSTCQSFVNRPRCWVTSALRRTVTRARCGSAC
jgi:hypothetical protein